MTAQTIAILALYYVLPLVIGVTAPLWFWKLGLFRVLRTAAARLASEPVPAQTPRGTPVRTISDLQTMVTAKQVVVVEHLKPSAEDCLWGILVSFVAGTIFTFVVFVTVMLALAPNNDAELFETITSWFSALSVSVPTAVAMVVAGSLILGQYQQLRNYREILQ